MSRLISAETDFCDCRLLVYVTRVGIYRKIPGCDEKEEMGFGGRGIRMWSLAGICIERCVVSGWCLLMRNYTAAEEWIYIK